MVYNNQKIDLNSNRASFSCNDELSNNFEGSDTDTDTTLRLACFGHSEENSKNGSGLVLGLGPTPSIYSNDYSSSGINRNKKELEGDSVLKLGLSHDSSTSKNDLNPFSNNYSGSFGTNNGFGISVLDEGSTSGKKSGGYIPSLLLAPRISTTTRIWLERCDFSDPGEQSDHGCPSESSVASHGDRRRCSKAARGKTEFCIMHGGGKRCVVEACTRSAELQPGLCISHGGGRRCTKRAQGSSKAHGGWRRCNVGEYEKFARHETMVQENEGGIRPRLFHGLVWSQSHMTPNNQSLSSVSASTTVSNPAKRRQLIPPQVLVPSSMKSSVFSGGDSGGLVVPEGRVHGGSLLALLRGNLRE